MPARLDPTLFPLREGGTVHKDLVAPYAATLLRRYGVTVDVLAARGGISVYELLMLRSAPDGVEQAIYNRDMCDQTVSQAMRTMSRIVAEWQAKRDADAEAAMLAMMEEGASEENAAV